MYPFGYRYLEYHIYISIYIIYIRGYKYFFAPCISIQYEPLVGNFIFVENLSLNLSDLGKHNMQFFSNKFVRYHARIACTGSI